MKHKQASAPAVLAKVPEIAAELSVSQRTIWRLIAEGHLESVRLGRSVRVKRASVTAFLAKGGSR